jgi:hypothetical protein
MTKQKWVVLGLLLFDLGGFVMTVAFLPRKGSWGHSGPISYFVNSRNRWDIAWAVLLALVFMSAGVYAFLQAKGFFQPDAEGNRGRNP